MAKEKPYSLALLQTLTGSAISLGLLYNLIYNQVDPHPLFMLLVVACFDIDYGGIFDSIFNRGK